MSESLIACRICKTSGSHKRFIVKDMKFSLGENFEYFLCSACNTLQVLKFIDTGRFYSQEFFFSDNPDSRSLKNSFKRIADPFFINGSPIISWLLKFIFPTYYLNYFFLRKHTPSKDSRILDVGCGSGNLLYHLKNAGYKNLLGIDPFIEKDIEYRNQLCVLKKSIFEIDDQFDLIMFNHSFEHLHNPEEVLLKVKSLLKTNGVCIIRIPTTTSYAWRHYVESWVQIDSPRHIFVYSKESLQIIADRMGFKLVNYFNDSSILQFIGSEQYIKGIPLFSKESYIINPAKSIFTRRKIRDFWRRTYELNRLELGDQACFIFKIQGS